MLGETFYVHVNYIATNLLKQLKRQTRVFGCEHPIAKTTHRFLLIARQAKYLGKGGEGEARLVMLEEMRVKERDGSAEVSGSLIYCSWFAQRENSVHLCVFHSEFRKFL